ncbi:hypothetical protein COCVIDRAFT_27135 [Bipolaris victoriae FI3]|uniref:Uncharacterized protein n=1 Tax=Bipolaris victoriae (strain FI3) TaxID=930091 RepID=W7EE22_BIPV3|nr:hypothetical protein COCVIDRAFT_27135 [Bipolaris victoriae FI3]
MANRAVYISAQDPRRVMRELLDIMHNDEDNNHLSLSCMRAMERYLVANLHQSSLPVSLLDEIRAADDRAIQQSRMAEAPSGNRRILRWIANVNPIPVVDSGESHTRVPRNITKSFLLTKYDLSVDEPAPVQHEAPPALPSTRGSSPTERASSVSTTRDNRLPRDVNRAFYMAGDDETAIDESLPAYHKPPLAPPNARNSSSTEKVSSAGTSKENRLPCDVNQAFYMADEDEPTSSSQPLLAQTSTEQTLAPVRNRWVLGEISNTVLRPVTGPGESHLGGTRSINQYFYVAEDDGPVINESPPVPEPEESHLGGPLNFNQSFYIAEDDPSFDEPPPVHHEPPRAPLNPRTQPSIRQPTRVSKPKANTQQTASSTLHPTQIDQPYRRLLTNANYDAAVTLEELEQTFIEETGPADDGSDTEEATEPDTPSDLNTAPAPHIFEDIPKIVVTDSRENIQAIVDVDPEQRREKTPDIPEYNFLKQKKAGFYDRAADEPQRLYPSTVMERRDALPPSWSARYKGRSKRSARPACSSPPIQRAGSAPGAAAKATEVTGGKQVSGVETMSTTGKRTRGAEPRTTTKRLRKPGGGRKDV